MPRAGDGGGEGGGTGTWAGTKRRTGIKVVADVKTRPEKEPKEGRYATARMQVNRV